MRAYFIRRRTVDNNENRCIASSLFQTTFLQATIGVVVLLFIELFFKVSFHLQATIRGFAVNIFRTIKMNYFNKHQQ